MFFLFYILQMNVINETLGKVENEKFLTEVNDNDLLLELINYFNVPLLCMSEDSEKYKDKYRQGVEINRMAIVSDEFNLRYKKGVRSCRTSRSFKVTS